MELEVTRQKSEQLREKSQQLLTEFIEREIQLGLTFAEVAVSHRNVGNHERFLQARRDAQTALDTARHFQGRIANNETLLSATQRLAELERAVGALEPGNQARG